jgi:hypothetical protein
MKRFRAWRYRRYLARCAKNQDLYCPCGCVHGWEIIFSARSSTDHYLGIVWDTVEKCVRCGQVKGEART